MKGESRQDSISRFYSYYLKRRKVFVAPMPIQMINLSIKNSEPIKIRNYKGKLEIMITRVPQTEQNKLDFHTGRGLEYISYFGFSDLSKQLYPTIEKLCSEYKINYKSINNLPELNRKLMVEVIMGSKEKVELKKRIGHNEKEMRTVSKHFTMKDIEEVYDALDLPKDKKIDKSDYLEFYLLFGDNISLYKQLLELKKERGCSWRDMCNLKYKDVEDYCRLQR